MAAQLGSTVAWTTVKVTFARWHRILMPSVLSMPTDLERILA